MPDSETPKAEEAKKPTPFTEEEPVITQGKIGSLAYTATTGRLPIKTDDGEIDAQMFYTAYVAEGADPGQRPVMFSFNGGPGSPSLWLHMGALGPKRVHLPETGEFAPPPYRHEENPQTWLHETDLVFIDPIGTGFSRGLTPEKSEKYWGVQGDIESVGEFIRLWLTRNNRWGSPLYLVGESYGTTRAGGLAGHLISQGIAFNGIVLVSSIMNFQTARFHRGNDLPYILFLPTYTATAFYHGKLEGRLGEDLVATIREVEAWALGDYASALAKGAGLPAAEFDAIAKQLSAYTGLSEGYCRNVNLRVNIWPFCRELKREAGETVGRLDSRLKSLNDADHGADQDPEFDPSMSAIMPPFTNAYLHYVHGELGYKTDLKYEVFGGIKKPWNWGSAGDGDPDTSDALRAAMLKNPFMKVFVASGYFDLATPHFATYYTLNHMGLSSEVVAKNFVTKEYEAGHMMYIHQGCHERLADDIFTFIRESK